MTDQQQPIPADQEDPAAEFQVLNDFLDCFEEEVSGRSAVTLSDNDKSILRSIAEDRADDETRDAALPLLRDSATAREFFANLLRAMLPPPSGPGIRFDS